MHFRNAVFLGLLVAGGCSAAYAADPPHGDAAAGAQKAFACAACHGFDGNSTTPEFPSLAGQDAEYIAAQLQAFKDGQRANQIMLGMAAALSPQDMRDVAAHFASQNKACRRVPLATAWMVGVFPVRRRAWLGSSRSTCATFSAHGRQEPAGAHPRKRKSCSRSPAS